MEVDQLLDNNIFIHPVDPDDEPTQGARHGEATEGDETTQLFHN